MQDDGSNPEDVEGAIARDRENTAEAHKDPHTGYHKHVCFSCGIIWDHQPEKCYLKSLARCLNCLRSGKTNAKTSIN